MNSNLTLISKPHFDVFTYNLFLKLLNTVEYDYKAFYIWSNPAYDLQKFLENTDFGVAKNVIIGIKDGLDMWVEFNYWHDTAGLVMQALDEMAQKWSDTNFIIVTSVENFALEHHDATNLQFVSWGGDWLNQHEVYKTLPPVLDKNFLSETSFISLNRAPRNHRTILLSYLFGLDINHHGYLSYLTNQDNNVLDIANIKRPTFLEMINWEFDELHHETIRKIIITGFDKFFANTTRKELIQDSTEIYQKSHVCDNIFNFEKSLRNKYKNSFVEIVSESAFTDPGFFITEKTAHCFYGCNFPIILGGVGIIDHLREIGFDMFDDIINHSYDKIANPFDRIVTAIDKNITILTDVELAKQLWKENRHRFIKNVEVMNTIDNFYYNRLFEQWKKIKWA